MTQQDTGNRLWKLYNAGLADGIKQGLQPGGLEGIIQATDDRIGELESEMLQHIQQGLPLQLQEAHRAKGSMPDRLERLQSLQQKLSTQEETTWEAYPP